MLKAKGRAPHLPLLRSLHWLPIPSRILYKTALISFKSLTTGNPHYLHSLLVPYVAPRSLRSSSLHLLKVPSHNTAFQARSFEISAPKIWNRLPQPLRDLAFAPPSSSTSVLNEPDSHPYSNLSVFKRNLKTFLFDLLPGQFTS